MITLRRLDLVRQDSQATAEELHSLQTQINALPILQAQPVIRVTDRTLPVPVLASEPSGFMEIVVRGTHYVVPFYAKA